MRVIIKEAGIEYNKANAPKVRTPAVVMRECGDLADGDTETFIVLAVDSKNQLIESCIVTTGLINVCLAHPREVFRFAVRKNAAAIVLAHNHPSGDPTPSAEDIRITRQLIEAGKILDIKVLDHIILGSDSKYISMREEGLAEFN